MAVPTALFKTLLVVVHTICCHICYTSPNPPPTSSERKGYKRNVFEHINDVLGQGFIMKVSIHFFVASRHASYFSTTYASSQCMIYPLNAAELLRVWSTTLPSNASVPGVISTGLIGVVLTAIGTIIRILAYHELGPDFSYILSLRAQHRLATRGVYSIVRHPAYAAFFVIIPGSFVYQLGSESFWSLELEELGGWWLKWGFGAAYVAAHLMTVMTMLVRTRTEDDVLHRVFGRQWEEWAGQTRYKLVPYVF